MSNRVTKEQKMLYVEMIELLIYCGYDILPFVGKPFSYFDYDKIANEVVRLKREKKGIDGK